MDIEQFADIIGAELVILRRCNFRDPAADWYAKFDRCEISDGYFLRSEYGNGHTPHEALKACAEQIRGKKLVFDAMSKDTRREFFAPADLTSGVK